MFLQQIFLEQVLDLVMVKFFLLVLITNGVNSLRLKGEGVCIDNGVERCCSNFKRDGARCIRCVGWFGDGCSLPCDAGMYGFGCLSKCNCTSCDRFNGTCYLNAIEDATQKSHIVLHKTHDPWEYNYVYSLTTVGEPSVTTLPVRGNTTQHNTWKIPWRLICFVSVSLNGLFVFLSLLLLIRMRFRRRSRQNTKCEYVTERNPFGDYNQIHELATDLIMRDPPAEYEYL